MDSNIVNIDASGVDDRTAAIIDKMLETRFSMQPAAIIAFRRAAAKSVQRLLHMVEDDKAFDKMTTSDKLKVMEMIFDRAYGKNETASTAALASLKTGEAKKSDHADTLAQLEARASQAPRRQSTAATQATGYPELQNASRARLAGNIVSLKRAE